MKKPKKGETRKFKILRPNGSIFCENGKFSGEKWLLEGKPPMGWSRIFVEDGWYWFEIIETNNGYPWQFIRKEKNKFIFVAECSENGGMWFGVDGKDEKCSIGGKDEADRRIKLLAFE